MIINKRIPFRFLLFKIRLELIFIILYSIIIEVLDEYFHIRNMSIPIAVPSFIGTTISLILAFRTNHAYDRWWEARKIWGAIINDSRSLIRQVINLPLIEKNSELLEFQKNFTYRQIAWCYALGDSLRDQLNLQKLEKYFPISRIKGQENIPNAILFLHSEEIREACKKGWFNSYQQICIEETIVRLCDSMGKCERIKKTIFPRIYSVFVQTLLYLFVAILPFGLIDYFGYTEAIIITALSSPFFMLEKAAVAMQDPFENTAHDIPVTNIAMTIEANLKQMLGEDVKTPPPKIEKFYIL
ncbi:MAG: hypothetical protein H7A25_15360 [Leptospiraceae bacterium]|nr:hypothetical protein [Leptospiraceae bacterium]MCP5501277.1 hypothetical protein [Leptospiraceae bacterium]